MKKVLNPTESPISIQFEGRVYELEANEAKDIADNVASFWKGIHNFLKIAEADAPAPRHEEEAPIEKEVKEEAPKEEEKASEEAEAPKEVEEEKEEKPEDLKEKPKKKAKSKKLSLWL